MPFYEHRNSHYKGMTDGLVQDCCNSSANALELPVLHLAFKTVLWPSCFYNWNPYTTQRWSLYWSVPQVFPVCEARWVRWTHYTIYLCRLRITIYLCIVIFSCLYALAVGRSFLSTARCLKLVVGLSDHYFLWKWHKSCFFFSLMINQCWFC